MANDYSQFTPVGGSAPAPAPQTGYNSSITPEDYFTAVKGIYPNAVFNGGGRSYAKNLAVGGAAHSMHLTDQAMDFNVPGVPSSEVFKSIRNAGLPVTESLNEGEIGSQGAHLHVGWAPKDGQPAANPYAGFTPVSGSAPTAPTTDYSGFTKVGQSPQPQTAPTASNPGASFGAQVSTAPKAAPSFGDVGQTIMDLATPGKANHNPNTLEQGIMGLAGSKPVQGITGAYNEGVTNGLFMQPTRQVMETMGVGMDKLKAAYPGQSDDWYQTHLHDMYNDAVTSARSNAARQTAANPYPGHIVGNTLAQVTAAPENLLLGGGGLGANIATRVATAGGANAVINTASDAAAQAMDIAEGQQKKWDVDRSLAAAGTGLVLGGVLHGAAEATPFVKQLFSDRGMDTTPNDDPRGTAAPTTSTGPSMSPADQAHFKQLLRYGDVDDIKNFLADKQGPKPTYQAVNDFAQFRDSLPQQFTGQDNFNQAADLHANELQRQAVENHIGDLTSNWKNAPGFEVVHGPGDIQDPIIRAQALKDDPDGNGLGFLGPDGKARIFSGRITDPDTASAVTFHEGLGHYGLEQQFGDKLDATLQTLLDMNVGSLSKDVDAWQEKNPGAYGGDRVRAAEEVLANRSQDGQMKTPWQDAVTAAVKQFGRKMGLKLSYSDAEVNQVLTMAHDAVINGKASAIENGFKGATQDPSNKFMFTGKNARTFDPNDRSAFTPSDGQVRNEISDRGARLTGMKMGTLGGTLDHPALYDQYPQLRNMRVIHSDLRDAGYVGAYDPDTKTIHLDNNDIDYNPLHTVLHEAQHAVQHIEGTLPSDLDTSHMTNREYLDQPHEQEAGRTESRRDLTNSERAQNPIKFMRSDALGEEQTDPKLLDTVDRLKADPRFWSDPEFRKNVVELGRTQQPVDTQGESQSSIPAPSGFKSEAEARAAQALPFMRKSDMRDQVGRDYVSPDLEGIYKTISEKYDPTKQTISLEETRRSALENGISASAIKDLAERNPGELAARVYRINAAAEYADMKVKGILDKLDTPDWSLKDEASLGQALAEREYLVLRAKSEGTEAARALRAVQSFQSFTNKTMAEVAEDLKNQQNGLGTLLDDREELLKFARSIKSMLTGGNVQGARILMSGINKPYWEQYLNSLHMNMMLSALSTHVKAPIDMATGLTRDVIEKAVAIPIGKLREVVAAMRGTVPGQGVTPEELAMHIYGHVRATVEAEVYRGMANAVKTGQGSFVDPSGRRVPSNFANQYGSVSNPRIPGVSIPTDLISAQDTFFRSHGMMANLYALGAREARAQLGPKASSSDVMTMSSNLARNPTISLLKEAHDLTDRALLLNNNPLNNAIDKYRQYRPGLTPAQRVTRFIVSNLAPFIRVESNNLLNRVIQRSPLGFIDPTGFTQKELAAGGARADIALAKIAYGTTMIGLSWMAANKAKNYLTGEGPENVDKYKEMLAGGYDTRSVHENGRYNQSNSLALSVNPFDQHNAVATTVAAMREAYDQGANKGQIGTGLKLALGSMVAHLADMSWIKDADPVLGLFGGRGAQGESAVNRFAAAEAGSWAPSGLRQAARLMDPNQHDIVDPHSIGGSVGNEFKSEIPGLSQTLPTRFSVYGEPLPNGASLTGVHTWLSSGNGYPENKDPTIRELQRLSSTDPSGTALITPVQKSFKFTDDNGDKQTMKLTDAQFEQWQQKAGQYTVADAKTEMNSPTWDSMSDDDRRALIKGIQSDQKANAREELFGR